MNTNIANKPPTKTEVLKEADELGIRSTFRKNLYVAQRLKGKSKKEAHKEVMKPRSPYQAESV